MSITEIHALVERSKLLSQSERTYWLQTLPSMTPDQVAKLETILTKASQIPWTEHVQRYFSVISQAAEHLLT